MAHETTLITGASSGIGRQLAHLFGRDGSDLILTARSQDKLHALAEVLQSEYGVEAQVLPLDLSHPDAAQAAFDRLQADGLEVDVLVNNAGFGARGAFAELDLDRQLDMIRLNVTALTHLTRLFLPGMLKRHRGGILNVASTAAFQPGPKMSVYYATKAYVLSLTEGLAEELSETGVAVSCLAPGPTQTRFSSRAGMQDTMLFKQGTMKAERVAQAGYRGFRAGKTLIVPGLQNKFAAFAIRFLPRAVVRKLVKHLQS